MLSPLPFAVVLMAVVSAGGLGWQVAQALGRPSPPVLSVARGSARRGQAYVFSAGLSPWAKESGRLHPWVLLQGMLLHAGVVVAFLHLGRTLAWAGAPSAGISIWAVPLLLGTAGGAGLLIRRVQSPVLRAVSVPDDFVASLLTTGFLAAALASVRWPQAVPAFHGVALALLAYVPLGKIRHCVYFFLARVGFGTELGHRGVLPPERGARA